MYKIKFKERLIIDRYKWIECIKEFNAYSFFDQGEVRCCKMSENHYKVINKENIIEQINL